MKNDEARERRARERRASLTLKKTTLEEAHRPLHLLRGAAAVSLVKTLTDEAWMLSGRPLPDYPRDRVPIRFVPRT